MATRYTIPDRIGFFRNGWLLDEVFTSTCRLRLQRLSPSRFEVRLTTDLVTLDLDLWTTPRGALDFWTDGDAPHWVPTNSENGRISSVASDHIGVHLENLDRNFYFLDLFISPEHWSMHFFGAGYLKLAPRRDVVPHRLTIHLPTLPSRGALRTALAHAIRVAPDRLVFDAPARPSPTTRATRSLTVTLAHGTGDFPVSVSVDSLEQNVSAAARLAKALGHCTALSDTPRQTQSAVFEPGGDFVPGPVIA